MRGILAVLFTVAVALTAGVIGFQAGIASNIGAAGGTVVLGGGFPGFGFLFFLFFVGFLLFAVGGMRRRAWAHGAMGGPGHWGGPGAWGSSGDPRSEWIGDAHRRLHEQEAAAAGTPGPAGTASAGSPSAAGSPSDRPTAG